MGRSEVDMSQDITRALLTKCPGRTAEVAVDAGGCQGSLYSLTGQVKLKWVQTKVLSRKAYLGSMTKE